MLSLLLAALLFPSPAGASEADAWLGRDRAALFESWVKDLEDGVPEPGRGARRLGGTWDGELSRARRRVLEASTKEDVYYALLSLKNTLHDGHGGLSAPESLLPEQARYRSPLRFRPERDRKGPRFVVSASTTPLAAPGLVLASVDGLTPARAMEDFREWHRTSSPEHLEFEFAHWLSARYSYDQPLPRPLEIRYELRDPATGKISAVTLPFSRHGYDFDEEEPLSAYRYPIAEDYRGWEPVFSGLNYRVYADDAHGALVLRVFSFNYRFDSAGLWSRFVGLSYKPRPLPNGNYRTSELLEKIDIGELERFLRAAPPRYRRLLVDVRDNGGGPIAEMLIALLTDKPFKQTTNRWIYVPLLRRDPAFLDAVMRGASDQRAATMRQQIAAGEKQSVVESFTEDVMGQPNPLGRYKVAVLSGPHCVSSCDQFVSVFADNAMGPVLGLPSQGESSPARGERRFKLANGETFGLTLSIGVTYRANGEPLEGNPARPRKPEYPSPGYVKRLLAETSF